VDAAGPHITAANRAGLVRSMTDQSRSIALRVIPTMAHLDPMPPEILEALTAKIDDSTEAQAGALAIRSLATNKSINISRFTDQLMTRADDPTSPSAVRVAAIYAIGTIYGPYAIIKSTNPGLTRLLRDPDQSVVQAAMDIGVK
jgi:hypothetical protein